jgi:hypothetical protein
MHRPCAGAPRRSLLLDTFPGIVIYYYAGKISQAFLPLTREYDGFNAAGTPTQQGIVICFFPV